jgi:exonuclease III
MFILAQNISGTQLKGVREGNVSVFKASIGCQKPQLVILSETRIHEKDFSGRGVLRGYNLLQHSSSGERRAGVQVYGRKGIGMIEGTGTVSQTGNYTVGIYEIDNRKFILAAMYGVPEASDVRSVRIMEEVEEIVNEKKDIFGVDLIAWVGDFNCHMEGNIRKPRTFRKIVELIDTWGLVDLGRD